MRSRNTGVRKLQVTSVYVNDLKENEYNPNQMSESEFNHLVKTIADVGFLQPILTWFKHDSEEIILDGAHRRKAMKLLNKERIDVVRLSDLDLLEMGKSMKARGLLKDLDLGTMNDDVLTTIAKTLTVNLNETKGEKDPLKFAQLLQSLSPVFNVDEMKDILNISDDEMKGYLDMLKVNPEELEKAMAIKDEKPLNEFVVLLTDEQHKVVLKAIETSGLKDNAEALAEICRLFNGSKGVIDESIKVV